MSGNSWEGADLGDAGRTSKFMRLMGGSKKKTSEAPRSQTEQPPAPPDTQPEQGCAERPPSSSDSTEVKSFNEWEKVNLGDDNRKDKFLRLMGAKKGADKAQKEEGPKTTGQARDDDKLQKDLEHQYQQSLQFKLSGAARRKTGLGFADEPPVPPAPEQGPQQEAHVQAYEQSREEKDRDRDDRDRHRDREDRDRHRDREDRDRHRDRYERDRDRDNRDSRDRYDRDRSTRDDRRGDRSHDYRDRSHDRSHDQRDRSHDHRGPYDERAREYRSHRQGFGNSSQQQDRSEYRSPQQAPYQPPNPAANTLGYQQQGCSSYQNPPQGQAHNQPPPPPPPSHPPPPQSSHPPPHPSYPPPHASHPPPPPPTNPLKSKFQMINFAKSSDS